MTTRGGKTVFGATVGILMLETQFPRIPGDIGNALTWPFPVQFRVVRGATPDNIVRGAPLEKVQDFIEAARDLQRPNVARPRCAQRLVCHQRQLHARPVRRTEKNFLDDDRACIRVHPDSHRCRYPVVC